jgi:uncharacterized protein
MRQRWDRLTFLHWGYDPEVVQRLLPAGLTVEAYQGAAWVGLVPFFMEVRIPGLPRLPWLLEFPETNVRTYVRGPEGESGVWFFSLDAARLAAVSMARILYRVPYFWSRMDVAREGEVMRYRSQRHPPFGRGQSTTEVRIGPEYSSDQLTEFDHYLTARWTLYGTWGQRLLVARAEHLPWRLHRATVLSCRGDLVEVAGLPVPTGDPIIHWSPGVTVRIGYPRRVG